MLSPDALQNREEKRRLLLERLAEGSSMRAACLELMIPLQTAMGWLRYDEAFRADYLQAKSEGADAWADRILELAEQAIREPEKANAIRVAIDSLKWSASKLKPRSYGDRIEQHVIDETPKDPVAIEERIKALEAELLHDNKQISRKAKANNQDKAETETGVGLVQPLSPPAPSRPH